MTEKDLSIRDFFDIDNSIVQNWRDTFPLKDGYEGCIIDIAEEIFFDAQHLIVFLKESQVAVGSVWIKGRHDSSNENAPLEVVIGIGDYQFMNKEALKAVKNLVSTYLKNSYPDVSYVLLFDGKLVDEVLK